MKTKVILVVVIVLCLINSSKNFANSPSTDLNGDCFVDFEDFAVLAEHWLKQ